MPPFYTGNGDDGFATLLGEERYPKHASLFEALGAVDEATAALGVARCHVRPESAALLLQVQRHLQDVMAEIAAAPEKGANFQRIGPRQVSWLEEQIQAFEQETSTPGGFIVPGDDTPAAYLDVARTIVRRAERRVAGLLHEGGITHCDLLRYLNRLSSLCFLLEVYELRNAPGSIPSMGKPEGEA